MSERTLAAVMALGLAAAPGCRNDPHPRPRVEMYIARAEQLERHSLLPEAVVEAEKAVSTDPDWAPAQAAYGRMLRRVGLESGAGRDDRLGHYRRARQALERAIELDGKADLPRIELAQLLADTSRSREAAALLEPVADDAHPEARFHLASILAELGEAGRAAELYQRGLELKPRDHKARIGYGIVLERSGDLAQSRKQLEIATRLEPESAEAFYRLGSVLAKLGDSEHAILALARASDLDPEADQALYSLAMVQRRAGQSEVAERTEQRFARLREQRDHLNQLAERLARNPDDVDTRSELSQSYLKRGQILRALAAARKVLELRPGDARAHRVLGACHRRLGGRAEALVEADQAVTLARRDPEAFELRGILRFENGDLDGAQRDLAGALDLGARSGTLFEHLARIALARDQPGEALRLATLGSQIEPPEPGVFKVAAAALRKLGDREQAGSVLLSLLHWRPADVDVLAELVALAHEYGDTERERRYREQLDFVRPQPGPRP